VKKNLRIVKIVDDKIFITPNNYISFQKTNFPFGDFGFKSNFDIYWQLELKNFNSELKQLDVEIIDYHPTDISQFQTQKLKRNINSIVFNKVKWEKLEFQLTWYLEEGFAELIPELKLKRGIDIPFYGFDEMPPEENNYEGEWGNADTEHKNETEILNPNNIETEIKIKFKFHFTKASFKNGKVEFTKYIKEARLELNFIIFNDNILEEFEHVKYFFPKAFKNRKKFNVSATIKFRGDKFTEIKSESKEIAQINKNLLKSIKQSKIQDFRKIEIKNNNSKGLYTSEEITELNDTEKKGNCLKITEEDVVQELINSSDIRNKRQLKLLSGKLHCPTEKIHFTLKPKFGFLFFIEGDTKNHYAWELLNSHATYIWSLDKSHKLVEQLKRIEQSIGYIRENGRNEYKSAHKQKLIDADILFTIFNHQNTQDNQTNGFAEWKHKVGEIII